MIARLSAEPIQAAFRQFPSVVLTGARQVGKTTLARALLPHATYVTLDDAAEAERARLSPEQFLDTLDRPVIVDEVQYAPNLFRHLKRAIDRRRQPGSFLLTGSQTFALMAGVSESLAGRAAVFTLPTLSLAEVFPASTAADTDAFLWRSGFPELWQRPELDRNLWLASYVTTYLERDVRAAVNVGDLRDFDRFLRAAALRAGQLLSYSELARDVGIAPNTAKRWLSVLQASQQIFLLEPYHRQRAKRLIKAPKLYFSDTGLLLFLLGFRSPADVQTHALWGAVWENFAIAEVRKRLQHLSHPLATWFWRTAHGDEVDLVIEVAPERFMAVEVKATERVSSMDLKGVRALANEYGMRAIRSTRVACRTTTAYPIDAPFDARATPLGGTGGLIEEVAAL